MSHKSNRVIMIQVNERIYIKKTMLKYDYIKKTLALFFGISVEILDERLRNKIYKKTNDLKFDMLFEKYKIKKERFFA